MVNLSWFYDETIPTNPCQDFSKEIPARSLSVCHCCIVVVVFLFKIANTPTSFAWLLRISWFTSRLSSWGTRQNRRKCHRSDLLRCVCACSPVYHARCSTSILSGAINYRVHYTCIGTGAVDIGIDAGPGRPCSVRIVVPHYSHV